MVNLYAKMAIDIMSMAHIHPEVIAMPQWLS